MSTVVEQLPTFFKYYILVVLFVCVVTSWGSTIVYVKMSPSWRANPIGSHMVWFMLCLSTFLTYYVVRAFWPSMPGTGYVLTTLFTLFGAVLTWRFVLFLRLMLEVRRSRRQHDG